MSNGTQYKQRKQSTAHNFRCFRLKLKEENEERRLVAECHSELPVTGAGHPG